MSDTRDRERWPELSPDGRWLAYGSDATGRYETYVQPWPGPGPREQVSLEGGWNPAWNPNGRELFFTSPPDAGGRWRMWAVDVQTTPLRIGASRLLFESASREAGARAPLVMRCLPTNCYSVSPDASRFFSTQILPDSPFPPVTHVRLVQGWIAEMKARVSGEASR